MSSISSASSSTATCEVRQVERAAFEMVAQAARRADDDRARRCDSARRSFIASMPPTQVAIRAPGLGVEPVELARDLQRQFAGRRDDQRRRAERELRLARSSSSSAGHGEAEGDGLARAGPRRNDQVAARGLGLEHRAWTGVASA